MTPRLRKQLLRLERGMIDPEATWAEWLRPTPAEVPEITAEQWRQMGSGNGAVR